jgi:hypothetical protein
MWSEFLVTDPEVPDSIPDDTRFSEKYWVWNGVHSASIIEAQVKKTKITTVGDPPRCLRDTHLSAIPGTNFAEQRLSLFRYNSLADSGHRVCFVC